MCIIIILTEFLFVMLIVVVVGLLSALSAAFRISIPVKRSRSWRKKAAWVRSEGGSFNTQIQRGSPSSISRMAGLAVLDELSHYNLPITGIIARVSYTAQHKQAQEQTTVSKCVHNCSAYFKYQHL
jgi:hypothetical protein